MENNEKNNLFKYATKELSQDAFICWLVNWYNYKDSEMYSVAEKFLNKIIEKANKKDEIKLKDYDKIDIKKQHKNIDVLINLKKNNEIKKCIIIEDKTFTKEHDKQIEIYKGKLESEYKSLSKENFITVYYKMIDYKEESNADIHIDINDMLNILSNSKIENNIYIDYKEYLKNIEKALKNFNKVSFSEWKYNKEIYWKFIYEYNEKHKSEKNLLSIKGNKVQFENGGMYIDFEDIKIKNNKLCKDIYFCLNFMNEKKCCLDIRGIDINKFNKEEKIKLSEKIQKNLKELNKNDYNISKIEISKNGKKAKQTILLVKVFFHEETNINNSNLYELLSKLKEFLENKI